MNLPHIKIGQSEVGITTVEVEDTELFDFIEDYLIEECDIEYEYMETSQKDNLSIYTLYFSKKFSKETIESAFSELDKREIENIYRLNNN